MRLTPAQEFLLKHPELCGGLSPSIIAKAFVDDSLRVCFASEIPVHAYNEIITKHGTLPSVVVQPYLSALAQDVGTWHLFQDRITPKEQREFRAAHPDIKATGDITKTEGQADKEALDVMRGQCVSQAEMEFQCVRQTMYALEEMDLEESATYRELEDRLRGITERLRKVVDVPSDQSELREYFQKSYIDQGILPPTRFPGMDSFYKIFVRPTRPYLDGSPDYVIHAAICSYILDNAKPPQNSERPDVVTREDVDRNDDILGLSGLEPLP